MKIIQSIIDYIVKTVPDYRFYPNRKQLDKINNAKVGTEFYINRKAFIAHSVSIDPNKTKVIHFLQIKKKP